ncbi:MAG TPA: NADH-quinone oxidoreductase subunit K [Longimicrobiales bacterium]|nr:NADH-quinone oxidoreductase subunit K [Longimicrobiales bacterium]
MEVVLAFTVGSLYGTGFYLLLRRSVIRVVMGISLLGQAANLMVFTSGGLVRGGPPRVPLGEEYPVGPVADPLAQALVLTAIVINFGMTAFALVLAARTLQAVGTDDADALVLSDAP